MSDTSGRVVLAGYGQLADQATFVSEAVWPLPLASLVVVPVRPSKWNSARVLASDAKRLAGVNTAE